MKVHPAIYYLGKNIYRLALVMVLVGIPLTIYYLRWVGIGFGAKEAVEQVLSKGPLRVEIGRLALDPFAGLLARKVVISEKKENGRMLANVSSLVISLNLNDLIARKISIDKLLLENAGVSIPADSSPTSARLEVSGVHAEAILLGDQLRLSKFDGTIEGIHVRLTGQFQNPKAFTSPHLSTTNAPAPAPASPPRSDTQLLTSILNITSKIRFPGGQPIIQADVEADLAKPDSLAIRNISLLSSQIVSPWGNVRSLELHGAFMNGTLAIPRLSLRDETGSLEASLELSTSTMIADLSIHSTLQPEPFMETFAKNVPAIAEWKFPTPPQLTLHASGRINEPSSLIITGLLAAPELQWKGVPIRKIESGFAWKNSTFYARGLRVSIGKGLLTANVWAAPNDYRLSAHSTIAPTELLPIFDPKTSEFIANMKFEDLPEVSVDLTATKLDFADIRGNGHLKFGRSAIRNSWMDNAASDFEIGDRCVTYKNFLINGAGGSGSGSFAYDVGQQEARLENIRATMTPEKVLLWIDPKIAQALVPYRFNSPPSTTVQGKVHLKDATKNNLSVVIQADSGLDYDLLHRTLHFGKTSAVVNVIGTKVHADIKRAILMGGTVAIKALVSIDPKDPTFGADVALSRVNFSDLTKLYFKFESSKGLVSGNYKFDARIGKENLMKGAGNLRVENGNVLAIPVLGPFSEILGTILPGVAYENAHLATADFTVANEIINSTNLKILGTGFSMYGAGDIHFMTGKLDMDIRLNARGLPGLVFYPVSKLLEYESTGTVSSPGWRPKIIPKITLPGAFAKPHQRKSPQ